MRQHLSMILTLPLGDLPTDGLVLHGMPRQAFVILLQLHASQIDGIDLQASVAHASINQHITEHEEHESDICLWERQQLIESAKVIRCRAVVRSEPETREVDADTDEHKQQQDECDLERGNQDFHVDHDDDECKNATT